MRTITNKRIAVVKIEKAVFFPVHRGLTQQQG